MTSRLIALSALLTAAFVVSACQTLTKEECVVADWASLGEADGAAGRSLERFSRHVEACKETPARPDQAAWTRGHAIGARRFCTPQNGVDAGNAGRGDPTICAPNLAPGFLSGYRLGEERRQLRAHRIDLQRRLDANRREMEEWREARRKAKRDDDATDRVARRLRRERRDILREVEDVDDDIAAVDIRIRRAGLVAPAPPAPID